MRRASAPSKPSQPDVGRVVLSLEQSLKPPPRSRGGAVGTRLGPTPRDRKRGWPLFHELTPHPAAGHSSVPLYLDTRLSIYLIVFNNKSASWLQAQCAFEFLILSPTLPAQSIVLLISAGQELGSPSCLPHAFSLLIALSSWFSLQPL